MMRSAKRKSPRPASHAAAAASWQEDADLARRVGEHDERAFETMMRAHNRLLYSLARSILVDDAEAEDAIQEAYFTAYRNIGGFRGEAKLSTWLARIVINEAYARLRKRRRASAIAGSGTGAPHTERDDLPPNEESLGDHTAEQPDARALRGELRRLLERRIDALPEPFRIAFILRDVEEVSVEDAARHLDVPAATVRTRAFRARAMLRESLFQDVDL